MMTRRILCLTLTLLCLLSAADAGAQKRKAAARPAANAKAATVNFSNCGDIWSIANDDKNIYVVIAWSKNMAVIDKTTGAMSKVTAAKSEINGVATHANQCYYSVSGKGIYRYDNATGLKGYSALAGKPTVFKWE